MTLESLLNTLNREVKKHNIIKNEIITINNDVEKFRKDAQTMSEISVGNMEIKIGKLAGVSKESKSRAHKKAALS